jgi:hypothetical protein
MAELFFGAWYLYLGSVGLTADLGAAARAI